MRLPVLIISTLTSLIIFFVGKRFIGFYATLSGLSLFCYSEFGIFYATHGRGYFLMVLCVVLALISFILFLKFNQKKTFVKTSISLKTQSDFYLIVFIGNSILGFYTIPVFLYPFLSIVILGFLNFVYDRNRSAIKKSNIVSSNYCYIDICTLLANYSSKWSRGYCWE